MIAGSGDTGTCGVCGVDPVTYERVLIGLAEVNLCEECYEERLAYGEQAGWKVDSWYLG